MISVGEAKKILEPDERYKEMAVHLRFLQAAYNGAKALVQWGILNDFEDTTLKNEGRYYGFGYSKRIVNTISDFLRGTPFINDYGDSLPNDIAWQQFLKDCDLYGTDFETWWGKQRRRVGTLGWVGCLIDMPAFSGSPSGLAEKGIYPYLSYYSPLSILEIKFDRDPNTNRPFLSRLKLIQDSPQAIQIWTPETIETWLIPEKDSELPELDDVRSGENRLKEIPFVFFINGEQGESHYEGLSDIEEIAAIDASLIIDGMRCSELLKKAAFPMLVMPKEINSPDNPEKTIKIGHSVILDLDPENPSARPFWLQAEVATAIDPMLKLWDKKRSEIYEIANMSGIISATESMAARSGSAFEQMFRFLSANLSAKVDNEIEARLSVIRFWLKWWGRENEFEKINIIHTKKFDIDKFINKIEDVLTGKTILRSSVTAQRQLEKRMARRVLQDETEEIMKKIDDEIDGAPAFEVAEKFPDETIDKDENV